ncbi:MAG TPA: aspartate aminotransferase family protein [Thermodesulfobacteriota bacterium]|nr:aspartate aminotransferase family protein [Thermodesulfobacteriota bacterium]
MNTEQIISKSERYLIHNYSRYPIVPVRGEGCWLWDKDGKRYLDFTTGIAVTNLGHSHPAILNAIEEQAKSVIHVSNLYHIEPQVELAEILVRNSFADKVFFCNSGTEANEGAIKLARRWGEANGGRYKIVSARGSFHGRTLGALSATGHKKYQKGFTPLVPGFKFVPYGKIGPLERVLKDEKICAVMLEPIQGENGVVIPPSDYLLNVRELCHRKKVLLILDEIQVGLGRTGRLFAYEDYRVEPDIMTLAKALGGGIPCGAVLARDEVAMYLTPGSHGSTLGGNALAMHAGCAVLKTILGDGLLDNAARMGDYFLDRLTLLQRKYKKLIKESRGKGLILGIELKDRDKAKQVFGKCMAKGLLTILTQERVIRILPPLIVNQGEIDFAIDKFNQSFSEVS